MTARVLPFEEWHRLPDYMDPVLAEAKPSQTRVCVVEDEHGEIVARWLLYPVCFAEDLWIAPSYRKTSIGRRLLQVVKDAAGQLGFSTLLSTAMTPDAVHLLEKVSAEAWPGPLMAFRVKEL